MKTVFRKAAFMKALMSIFCAASLLAAPAYALASTDIKTHAKTQSIHVPMVGVPFAHSKTLSLAAVPLQKEKDRLENQRRQAQKKHEILKSQVEGVDAALGQLFLDLKATEAQIPLAKEELEKAKLAFTSAQRDHNLITSRLGQAQNQAKHLDEEIFSGQEKLAKTQVAVGQIARQVYRGQQLDSSWWSLLFESKTTDELALRAKWAQTATKTQNKLIDQVSQETAKARNLRHRQEALTVRIGELEVQAAQAVKAADNARQEQEAKVNQINALQVKQTQLSKSLSGQKSNIEAQIKENEAFQAQAQSRIAQIDAQIRAEAAAAAAARAGGGSSGNSGSGGRIINGSGIFALPLHVGINVTSPYGYRIHPLFGRRIFHAGTDMAAGCGTPIFAAQSGKVQSASWDGAGGNSVYVSHGTINGSTWITVYRHMSRMQVSSGQQVSKGQQIGLVGTTGNSTGCHLHFEVYKNGSTTNPMALL